MDRRALTQCQLDLRRPAGGTARRGRCSLLRGKAAALDVAPYSWDALRIPELIDEGTSFQEQSRVRAHEVNSNRQCSIIAVSNMLQVRFCTFVRRHLGFECRFGKLVRCKNGGLQRSALQHTSQALLTNSSGLLVAVVICICTYHGANVAHSALRKGF